MSFLELDKESRRIEASLQLEWVDSGEVKLSVLLVVIWKSDLELRETG